MRKKIIKIKYEIKLKKIFYCIFLNNKRFKLINNKKFKFYNIFFIKFFILILIEINRKPFDFKEKERELISGFNIEYGKISFTFIFLKEYKIILFNKIIIKKIFCYFLYPLFLKFIIKIRKLLPRYRIDLIINLC
jgi:NADH:ubiquinone oxidoreductase subunit H